MSLSSPGIGSGLDVKKIVDAIVTAAITPAQSRHDKQIGNVNTELSAVGQLKSALANMQESLKNMSDISKFYNKKLSLNNSGYLSATATPDAIKGTYQIEVQSLAQKQSLATGYFADKAASIGSSGNMTITFGTYNSDNTNFTVNPDAKPLTLNISPTNNSITAVRDAINNSNADITATIIEDAQGVRLSLSSSQTGENYAMQISGDISALNYDPTTGVNALTQTMAAQNSKVLINGLTINQSTNQLENAISGIKINLTKAEPGTIISMTVEDNKDQVTTLINDFVSKYNESISFLTNLTGYDTETKQRGIFQGDPQFRSLKLNLTKWATTPLNSQNKSLQSLADLGIKTNKQGLLEINQEKFNKVLSANYNEIGTLFAKTATTTDANIRVNSFDSKAPAGTYAINLTEYTPGVSMEGTIGSSAASSTDGLTLRGSDKLSTLSIDVLSGSAGSRGNIIINDGIAVLMSQLIDTYMDKKGDLNQRNDQLNKQVTKLAKVQEQIDIRKDHVEQRYLKQFNALDVLMSNMQSISDTVTQLMKTLPSLKIK